MKLRLALAVLALCGSAFAWPSCSGNWVQVPTGTTGGVLYTTGDHLTFQCQTKPPTPDPKTTTASSVSNASSSSTSNSASSSSAVQSQKQQQNQSQVATGGNANATNEGNTTTYSSNYTEVRQTPIAYSPEAFSTSPCRSGFSGGGSSGIAAFSLGGSKRDEECASIRVAGAFAGLGNTEAAARILCETKPAKKAKLTLNDCLKIVHQPTVPTRRESLELGPPVVPSITVNVPPVVVMPVVTPVVTTVAEKPQVVTVVAKKRAVKKAGCPVTVKDGVKVIHEK